MLSSSSRLFSAVSSATKATRMIGAVRLLVTRPPGSNPLDVIRKECNTRLLCDEHGFRRPGVHWVFSLAVTPDDISQVSYHQNLVVKN